MLIDYISVLGCLPVRAMFAVHCNVAYTPQWALHTAAVGHHRQRQHDHNPWPPRPVVPSQQKAPHCICNCCSIMIAAKQLYKLLPILPAVDIKIIRGLPSIDSNSRKFNSVQLKSVCLSVSLDSLTCMAIARQCSAPDTVAMPRCAGSSSRGRGSSKTATTIALYTFPFSLQLKIANITLTFLPIYRASSCLNWFRHKNPNSFYTQQSSTYFVFLISYFSFYFHSSILHSTFGHFLFGAYSALRTFHLHSSLILWAATSCL